MAASKKGSVRVFEGQMKVWTANPKDISCEPTSFSPLPGESIKFYFKARSRFRYSGNNYLDFLLTLVRSPDSKFYPTLVMSVDASVYYFDGTVFKKYDQLNIKVDHLDKFDFETVSMAIYSNQFNKMQQGDISVHYKITFDHIPKIALSKNVKSSSSKFFNNLKCVYESAVFNDFVFNVGDKSFPVHRVILVAHSPVFMTMMTQDFEESKTGSVTITDTTPEAFEMFLKYLYCGEIEDKSWSSVKDLYCLADKYDVGILKNDCTDIVISLLSIDLVCEILKLAYMYDDASIKTAAKKFSVDHIKKLISREDWKELVVTQPIIGYEVIVNFVPT